MKPAIIRPATRADIDELVAEKLPYRLRGLVVERDGELLGFGALVYLEGGTIGATLMLAPGATHYAVTMHKAALRLMEIARELGMKRVVAIADPDIAPARRWLLRLGFVAKIVDGQEVFAWHS